MGRKTRLTIEMLLAGLFVMLVTVFLFTSDFTFSEPDHSTTGEDVPAELEDGTFVGTGEGFGGPIEVEVTVEGGEIVEITVLDHSETEGVSDPAFEEIPAEIMESNSTDVEVVSGATYTSTGIREAVVNALSGEGEVSEEETEDSEDTETEDEETVSGDFEDGTHTATVDGHNGPLTVEVTVEDGVITSVEVTEHEETEGLSDPAIEDVPAAIVENNSTDVDTVSGATVTSEAIIEAVNTALNGSEDSDSAGEPVEYTDGTYEGTADGHNGEIKVEVTVSNGAIENIVITDHAETEGLSDPAFEEVPAEIMETNSTDVDTVSGATVTSKAIISAVENALEDAQ